MLTLEQAKEYLRVTFPDDDALIRRLLLVSEEYLHHAVGTYDPNSKRVEMLQCIIVQDLYDERGWSEDKLSSHTRALVHDFAFQLRLEVANLEAQTV